MCLNTVVWLCADGERGRSGTVDRLPPVTPVSAMRITTKGCMEVGLLSGTATNTVNGWQRRDNNARIERRWESEVEQNELASITVVGLADYLSI